MNIFKVYRGYRDIGLNYGLPVFYVVVGMAQSYDPLDLIKKLAGMGLRKERWVVIKNNPVGERGCGVFVQGLKRVGCKVEIEDDGSQGTPGWFPLVDRWTIYWKDNKFNYGSLRHHQDLLIYDGDNIPYFLEKTKDFTVYKAILTDDRGKVWDLVKDMDIRVYKRQFEED